MKFNTNFVKNKMGKKGNGGEKKWFSKKKRDSLLLNT